jgi:HAD superfamily hydrolase (TIGR01509 family)
LSRLPRFPVYLFDIDGTLLDSQWDICAAVSQVLSRTSRPDIAHDVLRSFIGRHLNELFSSLFPDLGQDGYDALVAEYRSIYLGRGHKATKPYPGSVETVAALGGRKSTATTKGTPTTRAVLEQFGFLTHLEHVQGTDGFGAKPEPEVVLRAIAALGVQPRDCLLVGDSAPDMEAGRRAGVATCAATWGYGDQEAMRLWSPDYWIDDIRELLP